MSFVRDNTFKHPAEVPIIQNAGIPLASIVGFHLHYVLMKLFSVLITHYSKVLREKVQVRMKNIYCQAESFCLHKTLLSPLHVKLGLIKKFCERLGQR